MMAGSSLDGLILLSESWNNVVAGTEGVGEQSRGREWKLGAGEGWPVGGEEQGGRGSYGYIYKEENEKIIQKG